MKVPDHKREKPIVGSRVPLYPITSSLLTDIGFWNAGQEFKKREPKITKLKGGYSTSATLIFNSWLKDIEMYVFERKLSNGNTIQLVEDCTSDQARNAV